MLEFNMPVHESWNIVHIAMQVPESHQIYVCPENCMRGVVMTAYEMGAADRFSCVTVSERDLIVDNLETITIEGAAQAIEEMETWPKIIFLFTVCSHRFLSCDFNYVFRRLRERFPEIVFAHGYMDCIAQKEGPMPDEKLRREMYAFVPKSEKDECIVNLLGSEVTGTYQNNDLVQLLTDPGMKVRQLSDISTFDGYMKLGNASLNLCQFKAGDPGVRSFSEKLGIPYLLVLPFFDQTKIREQIEETASITEVKELLISTRSYLNDLNHNWQNARQKFKDFNEMNGRIPVVIDHLAVNCPYSLAEFLTDTGFEVRAVVADGPADYETDIYERLMQKCPSLISVSPTDPRLREQTYRNELRGSAEKILAIGPKAAWVYDTPFFVNQIENDGAYGIAGLNSLLAKMQEAVQSPKDLEHTIVRKALGLKSCIIQ